MFGHYKKDRMDIIETLPMVPLRDVVGTPSRMMIPFVIGRSSSIRALSESPSPRASACCCPPSTTPPATTPGPDEIYTLGTICNIVSRA